MTHADFRRRQVVVTHFTPVKIRMVPVLSARSQLCPVFSEPDGALSPLRCTTYVLGGYHNPGRDTIK